MDAMNELIVLELEEKLEKLLTEAQKVMERIKEMLDNDRLQNIDL